MPLWKEKALGLNSRKAVRWLSVSLSGFQYLLNLLQSWRMWCLDLIGYSLHGQWKSSLGKNLRWYSLIGAWFRMTRVALAHNKLECLRCLIHGLSRMKESGLNIFLFSFQFIFLYSIFRTRVRVGVTRSCCHTAGHIRWYGHKSHDIWKEIEGSERMTSYNMWNTCWP